MADDKYNPEYEEEMVFPDNTIDADNGESVFLDNTSYGNDEESMDEEENFLPMNSLVIDSLEPVNPSDITEEDLSGFSVEARKSILSGESKFYKESSPCFYVRIDDYNSITLDEFEEILSENKDHNFTSQELRNIVLKKVNENKYGRTDLTRALIPKRFASPKEMIFQGMFDGKYIKEKSVNMQGRSKDKDPVYIVIQCNIPDDSVEIIGQLNQYDMQVYRGIFTLLDKGYNEFTAKMLYESYTGKSDPNAKQINEMMESLHRMSSARVSLDWTDLANKWKNVGKYVNKYHPNLKVSNRPFLVYYTDDYEYRGRKTTRITIPDTPPTFALTQAIGQISRVNRIWQNVDLDLRPDTLVILNYLIFEIDIMIHNAKYSRNLYYKTIFDKCQISGNLSQLSRYKKYIHRIFDSWVEHNLIKDYKIHKERNAPKYIEVILNKDNKSLK